MNVWTTLGQWADRHLNSLSVILVEAPPDQAALIGRMAILESPEAEPRGPLTEAPFWAGDWAGALRGALADIPAEAGRRVECDGRRYYLSPLFYSRSALVMGGGHVGGALCRLLRFLDFDVTLMDDRADFLTGRDDGTVTVEGAYADLGRLFPNPTFDAVVIVTRGHAQDSTCLRQALSWPVPPPYLGMIGSRRRTRETLAMLTGEGYDPERLRRVHTPIGLAIGAQSPAEIAVSIAAEIIQVLNAGGES